MDLHSRFRAFVEEQRLLRPGEPVLVGVSGGVDSMVLAHLCREAGFELRVAHANYGLRGEASEADEALVREWCAGRGVPFAARRLDAAAHARADGLSMQAAARALRYAWFAEAAGAVGAKRVAVAHQLDDQAETILLNLFRGAGLEGLAGMRPRRPLGREGAAARLLLVRPLLFARREEIERFARDEGLAWREDASNSSLSYRRNALRNVILPAVAERFGPQAVRNVVRAGNILRAYLESPAVARSGENVGEPLRDGGVALPLGALRGASPVWRRLLLLRALARWAPAAPRSEAVARGLERLISSQPGRRLRLRGAVVWRDREALVIRPDVALSAQGPVPLAVNGSARIEGGTVRLDEVPLPASGASARPEAGAELVDLDLLGEALVLRPWQAGDRFRPIGFDHRKKVSDLLTDRRVPSHARARVHVLLSGDRIAWVVGHRLAEAFRVRSETRRVGRLLFTPDG